MNCRRNVLRIAPRSRRTSTVVAIAVVAIAVVATTVVTSGAASIAAALATAPVRASATAGALPAPTAANATPRCRAILGGSSTDSGDARCAASVDRADGLSSKRQRSDKRDSQNAEE
jgi:hypothetical protein